MTADGTLRVGWLGAGRMGATMVRRLLGAGYEVTVYNRTPEKVEPLRAEGAERAATIAELASQPVVFTAVGGDSDLVAVTTGEGGLLSGESVPGVLVDCSTVSREASAQVRERASARGVAFLAAPVSGNPGAVERGLATFAVSGPRQAYDQVLPALEAIGAQARYVGEGDRARLVKLCHNLFLGVVIQSLVEVSLLAEKAGVAREDFLAFLNASVLGSVFTGYKTPALVSLDFNPTFTSSLLEKDMNLGLDLARSLGVPLPLASLATDVIASLVKAGYGDEDFAALIVMEAAEAGVDLGRGDRREGDRPAGERQDDEENGS